MAKFEVLSRHLPGGTLENHEESVRIAGLCVEIGNQDVPNTTEC
jgi:hypothetical protein